MSVEHLNENLMTSLVNSEVCKEIRLGLHSRGSSSSGLYAFFQQILIFSFNISVLVQGAGVNTLVRAHEWLSIVKQADRTYNFKQKGIQVKRIQIA